MQDSKYYYQGIPISEYCKKHNINVNTIRGRIWKKLHNKKYEPKTLSVRHTVLNIRAEQFVLHKYKQPRSQMVHA